MAKIRKRRPGGGRKPQGSIRGKTATFSTRVTAETRRALEREAAATGQSISQAAERLMQEAIGARRRRRGNNPMRALLFLIEQLALGVGGGQWLDLNDPAFTATAEQKVSAERSVNAWRHVPFKFRAFEIAVAKLLNAMRPKGAVRPPLSEALIEKVARKNGWDVTDPALLETMKANNRSPENLASYVATNVWIQLNRTNPLSEREREMMGQMMLEEFYAMADARRDLLIHKGEGK